MACGLWLGYYAVDSQHQKQTYETLAKDFLLEEPESSLSLAEDDSSGESSTAGGTVVTLITAPPRHDLAALQAENPACVGWLTIPDTTVDYPHRVDTQRPRALPAPGFLRQLCQRRHTVFGRPQQAPGRGTEPYCIRPQHADGSMFKPLLQYLTPNFRQTHQDIYLELNGAQYHYQYLRRWRLTPVHRYTPTQT